MSTWAERQAHRARMKAVKVAGKLMMATGLLAGVVALVAGGQLGELLPPRPGDVMAPFPAVWQVVMAAGAVLLGIGLVALGSGRRPRDRSQRHGPRLYRRLQGRQDSRE